MEKFIKTGNLKMYSEAFQDEFVDIVLKGQKQGYFVDVGGACDDHKNGSNSLMFEERGWNGIIVDAESHRMVGRSCSSAACWIGDGSGNTRKLGEVLKENNVPVLVDYLSIDIEGEDFKAVNSFVESGFTFKVATIEHNLYSRNPGDPEATRLKSNIFNFLASNGYVRIVDNAGNAANIKNLNSGWPFEDWYINPKYINYRETIQRIKALQEATL